MKNLIIILILIGSFWGCKKDDQQLAEVKACFELQPNEINDGEVQFTNCSNNAVSYLWNFGDGKTSTEVAPMHLFEGNFPFSVTLIAYNGRLTDTITKLVYDDILVKKPNIYIYPLYQLDLCVKISFPMGGNIVQSIPNYNSGWNVKVNSSGRIDNQYDYLFYESKQPNIFQYKKGWCIPQKDLKSFFESNMKLYNFSGQEIKDFTDYWIPLLKEGDFYCIYPQTKEIIDNVIQFDFSIQPNNIYRLFYGIVGTNKYSKIEEPTIKPFDRSGFYVVEWGVFNK